MREDLLYHVWKFQKLDSDALISKAGEKIKVFHPGARNEQSGPDFFNARIQIEDQLWAGNVEVHIKASDWYLHHHETDSNYDNVILHVVWEQDVDIFRKDGSRVATLELMGKVDRQILDSYENLFGLKHSRINCEEEFARFSDFQIQHWLERLYIERLEHKSFSIAKTLEKTGNNWETTLFIHLFQGFGLNLNGEIFGAIAASIPFKYVQKLSNKLEGLESLFLGQAGLINGDDVYARQLAKEYEYLKHKFSLDNKYLPRPQFFRLRPNNFPTIRLAELAALYHKRQNLFSDIIRVQGMKELYDLFDIQVSEYWESHYNFGAQHSRRTKKLTKAFIDLLAINCLVPIKDYYGKYIGNGDEEKILQLISEIKAEKNSRVDLFNDLRPGTATSALESQAVLQLKNEYCDKNRCLHCELGASLLKGSAKYP